MVLARALGVDPPVLVLVEPTSAVDAHTEARIAERVAAARRGRTTVVTTVSPLWLRHADRVVLLEGGRVAAVGSARGAAGHAGVPERSWSASWRRAMSERPSDLLATSAATWRQRDPTTPPGLGPDLVPPPSGTPLRARVGALRSRHRLRRRWAEGVYAESRSPARGWPVSGEGEVVRFVGRLVRSRLRTFTALVVINALAAVAALTVPRLLGELVDHVAAAGPATQLGELSLVIVAVVVAQAVATFAGQVTSTVFGQNLLASMREYVVDTILRLPLEPGRSEQHR